MIRLLEKKNLQDMTTFGLPVECGRLVEYDDYLADLPELDREGLLADAFVIGGGSNLLFASDVSARTFLHPVESRVEERKTDAGIEVTATAGVCLDDLCSRLASRNLWGTENLSGIPGHIGGAAVQNVGAYGAEFKDVVVSLECYLPAIHDFVTLRKEECRYGYRDSVFKHLPPGERLIVCSATLRLSEEPVFNLRYQGLVGALGSRLGLPENLRDKEEAVRKALLDSGALSPLLFREAVTAMRDSKLPDPARTGSAGSFFKNPVVGPDEFDHISERWREIAGEPQAKVAMHPLHPESCPRAEQRFKLSAAWLIDKAGCKGMTSGGAALWPQQPLVLVNASGTATAANVVTLERAVIARVRDVFGITLSPEVIHI